MAHDYVGIDVPTAIVPPYVAGKGFFSIGVVTDDLDDRDAGSAMAAVESARDCINWLTWRSLNPIDGSVHTQTTVIDTSNIWKSRGDCIHYAPLVHSGNLGWRTMRETVSAGIVADDLTNTITPSHGDVWLLDTITTSDTALILAPLTGVTGCVEFTLVSPPFGSTTHGVNIYDTARPGGGFPVLVGFSSKVAGWRAAIVIVWNGSAYFVKSTFVMEAASVGTGPFL